MSELIYTVMNDFDFERVHKAMVALDWEWKSELKKVPSIEELKSTAIYLLCSALRHKNKIRTGGFSASFEDGELYLDFTIERASSEMTES